MVDIDATIAAMTLEEKCACLTGEGYWVLGGCPRLGIGPVAVADGPHGLRKQIGDVDNLGLAESEPAVCFPTASASACSFDVDLMKTMGEAIGDEARGQEVSIVLGPGVNMKRSPLCGRNFEYFSEDPYLAGTLAAAYIEGVQSRGVGTSLKHFAANNQERNRLTLESVIDERALHELYLEPFRIAVERAQPWTVMTAYNLLNGTYCSENEWLMTDVARGQWGFGGAFITDWGAENSNRNSLPAGLDLVMPGPRADYRRDVAAAVENGTIAEKALDAAVRRVLALHDRCERGRRTPILRDVTARLGIARAVAAESAVLLENRGALPLPPDAKVAVIGAFACQPRYQGAGSSKINPVSLDCALDALQRAGVSCRYASGYDVASGSTTEELLAEAVCAAREVDVAVVFAGLPDAAESEGVDRCDMALPEGHTLLIERVCAANENTVVVLQGGAPIVLPGGSKANAVLLSYLAGCEGGSAVADILTGRVNPSGKLAETWPVRLEDTPCADCYPATGRRALYRESLYVGYRYYDAAHIDVAYPFGHGLSYTSFEYADLDISSCDDGFTATCTVHNVGEVFGKEVVQLYVAPIDPDVFKAPQQLKGFVKIALQPGEKRRVSFDLSRSSFAHYDPSVCGWQVEAGSYEFRVAASSRDVRLRTTVEIDGVSKHAGGEPTAYRSVEPCGFSDEAFAELCGKSFPKIATTLRPYTANSLVGDLKTSLIGRAVHYILRRELKLLIPNDKRRRKTAELMVMDVPLRTLAMSGIDMTLVDGVVDILNYRFIRGYKKLHSLKPNREK